MHPETFIVKILHFFLCKKHLSAYMLRFFGSHPLHVVQSKEMSDAKVINLDPFLGFGRLWQPSKAFPVQPCRNSMLNFLGFFFVTKQVLTNRAMIRTPANPQPMVVVIKTETRDCVKVPDAKSCEQHGTKLEEELWFSFFKYTDLNTRSVNLA